MTTLRDGYRLEVDVDTVVVTNARLREGRLTVFFDAEPFSCTVVRDGDDLYLMRAGATEKFSVPKLDAATFAADARSDGRVAAPMPGQIIAVFVKVGAAVRRDQPILVLEAMKMEHTMVAPIDGTLEHLGLAVGDRVVEGAELFRIAEHGARTAGFRFRPR